MVILCFENLGHEKKTVFVKGGVTVELFPSNLFKLFSVFFLGIGLEVENYNWL
jgi:hypothetical protein